MLTFDFTYTCDMTIIFDSALEMKISGALSKAINKITWAFNNYPFKEAIVINSHTGEILLIAHNN